MSGLDRSRVREGGDAGPNSPSMSQPCEQSSMAMSPSMPAVKAMQPPYVNGITDRARGEYYGLDGMLLAYQGQGQRFGIGQNGRGLPLGLPFHPGLIQDQMRGPMGDPRIWTDMGATIGPQFSQPLSNRPNPGPTGTQQQKVDVPPSAGIRTQLDSMYTRYPSYGLPQVKGNRGLQPQEHQQQQQQPQPQPHWLDARPMLDQKSNGGIMSGALFEGFGRNGWLQPSTSGRQAPQPPQRSSRPSVEIPKSLKRVVEESDPKKVPEKVEKQEEEEEEVEKEGVPSEEEGEEEEEEGEEEEEVATVAINKDLEPLSSLERLGLKPGRRVTIRAKDWAGEVVWAKLGRDPWWPAQVLDESDSFIPDDADAPRLGAVPVRFFGTYDFAWMESQRSLNPFNVSFSQRISDTNTNEFNTGVNEALEFQHSGTLPQGFADAMEEEEPVVEPRGKSKKTGKRRHEGPEDLEGKPSVKRRVKVMRALGLAPPEDSPYAHVPAINPNLLLLASKSGMS
ncbi:hypothetical protein BSKO_03774 [Bryopsis sp. KO-2023]|nr:hypothetical protein BSKO_03774 [Bryopsis sp. KO-2023]